MRCASATTKKESTSTTRRYISAAARDNAVDTASQKMTDGKTIIDI